jgi:hypothetical protein
MNPRLFVTYVAVIIADFMWRASLRMGKLLIMLAEGWLMMGFLGCMAASIAVPLSPPTYHIAAGEETFVFIARVGTTMTGSIICTYIFFIATCISGCFFLSDGEWAFGPGKRRITLRETLSDMPLVPQAIKSWV